VHFKSKFLFLKIIYLSLFSISFGYLEAVVVATQANLLGKEWLGRKLDKSFLKHIKRLKNVDVCGENGEFHSIVIDGPIFKQRIDIIKSHKILREGYWFLDIEEHQLIAKNKVAAN
jgi:diphthine-ammonia ligase